MDWLPNSIGAIGSIVEMVGLTGLVLILATILIIAAIYWNRRMAGDSPAKSASAASDVLTPFTCKWSELDRHEINRIAEKIKDMDDRQKSMERDMMRVSAMVSRYPSNG